jgi:hypothetical protein
MRASDLNGDGWPDVVSWSGSFQTGNTYELDILLNDGTGHLTLGTSQVFAGTIPSVMEGRELVLADFNGDGRADIFIADQGQDTPEGLGYQNTLVLSAPDGRLVDATSNLPEQSDFSHSATAADIDSDGDIDLFVGNIWGQSDTPPQILVNTDGTGVFAVAAGRLPFPVEDNDFGAYTASAFVDVNNDSSPDLILGDAGDDLDGGPDSLVLLNNGSGYFSYLDDAIPAKPFALSDIVLDIDAMDIDSDGYLDLILVYTREEYIGRYIQLLINNQDGTFRDETALRLPQSDNNDPWIIRLDVIDIDGDGHEDIMAAPLGGEEPLFHLNNGDGTFRSLPNVFNIETGDLFTFLDLDQNGFLDVVWSWGDGSIYIVRSLECPSID